MAITAYTGPPGAGKSYALVSQVILPALAAGRRVITNVDGCDPDRFLTHVINEGSHNPGQLVLFEGQDALLPGFFPTQARPDGCTVQPGDVLVFDEWRLTFSNRGPVGNPDLEPFLRWHRHLTSEAGTATDVVIGSQLITDIHRDFRGLVERSYKFRKLSAVGAPKFYTYDVYEGHEQRKNTAFRQGNGKFSKEIFALYKSFDTDKAANEKSTDGRATLFSKPFIAAGVVALLLIAGGAWKSYHYFTRGASDIAPVETAAAAPAGGYLPPLPVQPSTQNKDGFRIVGTISSVEGVQVIVANNSGATRVLHARDFQFEGDRPISGTVEGIRIYAEDRVSIGQPSNGAAGLPALLPGQLPSAGY